MQRLTTVVACVLLSQASYASTDADNDGILDYCDADFPLVIADTELKQHANPAGAGMQFGNSVSIDGDYAVVGAQNASSKKGWAFIFVNSHDGSWSRQARLT